MCEPDYFGAACLDEPSSVSVCTVTMCQFFVLPAGAFLAAIASMSRTRDAFRRFLTAEVNDAFSLASQQAQLRNAKVNCLKERWRLSAHNRELRNLISDRERDVAALKPQSAREKTSARFSMVSKVMSRSAAMTCPDQSRLSRQHEMTSLVDVTVDNVDRRSTSNCVPPPPPLSHGGADA